ncbi:MAG: EAL domain-containing protein [Acidimicrobiales bacterium]
MPLTPPVDELAAARAYIRLLLEAQRLAGLGSWKLDVASGTVEWSSEAYRIFGLEPDAFAPTRERVFALFHEADLPRLEAGSNSSMKTGEPFQFRGRIRRPNGEVRWVETIAVPSIVDGVLVGLVGIFSDVTERESSIANLRESEARYKMIVETANDAIWVVDANGVTTFANERLAILLGRPIDELVGTPVSAFHDEEGTTLSTESFAVLREGRSNRLDFRFVRPDGSEIWTLISAAPILDAHGQYTGALAMLTDITERHSAEMELRSSQSRLTEAQRMARLANWSIDRTTGNVTCSDELFEMLGVDPAVGVASLERFMLLVHPDDLSRGEAFLRHVNGESLPTADELRIITPAGQQKWLSLSVTPVVDEAGRVTEMQGIVQDISERRAAQGELAHLALHDKLTGLPNRVLFNDRLGHALIRRNGSVSVLLLDLDGFKAINDSLGYAAGDALLVTVAKRMANALRSIDTVARFGGDEFTVLLDDAGDEEARQTSERLLLSLAAPIELNGRMVRAQASIGYAVGAGDEQNADDLVRDADAAMFVAKGKGGNRYEAFDTSMHAAVVARLALECDIRSAKLGTEMTLHYQPIVDLDDGHLAGFEALLRWNHPQRGMLSPADFVPIAESIGAIVPIGRWVVEEACRQASEWRDRYPKVDAFSMSVNVSARQLADPGIVDDVAHALRSSGLDPACLTLEITETMILADEEEVHERLLELKKLGVRISVDDFGTGYSSLGHLDRFPIDELKIDRSFVASLGEDSPDSGVALAVILLARSLRVDVVAEGIERKDQLIELRRSACGKGQGYYLWRPMDAQSVEALLLEGGMSALPALPPRVVLIVDDDDDLLRSTGRLLRGAGIHAIEARTALEGLRLAGITRLDAVILDIHLPDIDGFEMFRRLEEQFHGEVPVLYISGVAFAVEDRIRGLNLGAAAYLTKPVAPEELLAVLGSILRRKQSSHAR